MARSRTGIIVASLWLALVLATTVSAQSSASSSMPPVDRDRPLPSPAPSLSEKPLPPPQAAPADGAPSADENAALGFMRTILTAEKLYKKKHNHYAPTLGTLAGTGSVTTRMVKSRQRSGYTVGYSFTGEGFSLTMTPITFDAQHRAFYTDSSGLIREEPEKPATSQSPVFKQK